MYINEFFKTPIWTEEKKEYLKSLTKATNKYIKAAKSTKESKKHIKKYGDFGNTFHSTPLTNDNNILDFKNYVESRCWEFLDYQGFDMSLYTLKHHELWVQEFAKKGSGHHSTHIHSNQHVSGFYFLKSNEKSSQPIFYDPRGGFRSTRLKMKSNSQLFLASEKIFYSAKPGTLIIFPGYLEHEFSVDYFAEPFRFIHFNLQAIPNQLINPA